MIGLYFHIPFCKKACSYCDFHFSTQLDNAESMVNALLEEWKSRKPTIANEEIHTIYFGGGTPSHLAPDLFLKIISQLQCDGAFDQVSEFTLEVNPDDINPKQIAFWKSIGVNRLSIGIQSFDDHVLKWMNRAHNAQEAKISIELCLDSGIQNLNLDMIYGHHQYKDFTLEEEIATFLKFEPKHISAYALTIEPKTALHYQFQKGLFTAPEQEIVLEDYLEIHQTLTQFGMKHYELSNFAIPGFESKHNSNYWKGQPYIGVGPSAHSFDGKNVRSWNLSNNKQYIKFFLGDDPSIKIKTSEILSPIEMANEYWMTGLRTAIGVSLLHLQHSFNMNINEKQTIKINQWCASGHLIFDGNTITCSPEGWLVLDAILSDVFFD